MSLHVVGDDGEPLCPEAAERDALSDTEYWARVLGYGPDVEGDEDFVATVAELTPCPECGSLVACAYDTEGRALMHVLDHDE